MARKERPHGTGSLVKRTPGGVWVCKWTDGSKRPERSTGTTDKAEAARILAQHVNNAALRRAGIIDTKADRYAQEDRKPLNAHLDDWKADLVAKGVTAKHTNTSYQMARRIVEACKADRLSGLCPSAVQGAIGELASGVSLRTCAHYLRAVKSFSRWLRRDGRIREDSLQHLVSPNFATDLRHERRALDDQELGYLLATTETAPTWHGMSGPNRARLYRVAAGTGFRAGELRSLTPDSFDLDEDPPAVTVKAADSKHRREDRQPIRQDLAGLLKPWLEDKPADTPVFANMPARTADMIRADLRRARVKWIREAQGWPARHERHDSEFLRPVDSSGKVCDFHALRNSYITALVRSGASVKVCQQLARHSDPKLTLNVYTRLGVHDLTGALEALPAVAVAEQEQEAVKEATNDTPTTCIDSQGANTSKLGATQCDDKPPALPATDSRKPLKIGKLSDSVRDNAADCGNTPGRAKTCDRRISNPMQGSQAGCPRGNPYSTQLSSALALDSQDRRERSLS